MAPSSAVVNTLRHVTEDKLKKLALLQQSDHAERQRIAGLLKQEPDLTEQVRQLLKQVKKTSTNLPDWIPNVTRFVDQARHDASVTSDMLEDWRDQLLQIIGWQAQRYEYTSLFGKLVTEWIENPNEAQTASSDSGSEHGDSATNFEPVGREEMHEQRKQWEEYTFNEKQTDKNAIYNYLDGLFLHTAKSRKSKKTPLERLRLSMSEWYTEDNLRIAADRVKLCIRSILRADLFSGDKRQALEDLLHQPAVLAELADVLNSDLASLDQWAWSPSPVPLSMRRQVNGKYRVYMDQEVHQAILLQFIGITFAVHLKATFKRFFTSGAWLQAPHKSMSRRDALRREYFLGDETLSKTRNVRQLRRTNLMDRYFLTQLPGSLHQGNRDYGDDGDSESDSEDDPAGQTETPLEMKRKILYLITTESLVSRLIYGNFTVVQSDFKWFGPSMPHSTLLSVLEYFHVPQRWLDLFRKFLTPTVYFSQDGKQAEARQRARGMPMGHVLSDALGEVLMFCLDFAVNQRTKGGTLYRFHDDLWYWGVSEDCETAWKAVVEFTQVMGLELNEDKTGTVTITEPPGMKTKATSSVLPKGRVKWGFLNLDSASGRWLIDEEEVDKHIVELKRQLQACRSVFAYVQAFNAYVNRFMLNNLGWPANCLGTAHIDMCIATIKRVQQQLFGLNGTITTHLRKTIETRFGNSDLPDAFFYFPEKLGGLNVSNPLITLLLKRDEEDVDPIDHVKTAFEEDEDKYETAKENFEAGKVEKSSAMAQRAVDVDEGFMSLKEFINFREERSEQLASAYELLQTELTAHNPTVTQQNKGFAGTREVVWSHASYPQYMWNLELYGREAVKKCGDIQLAERKLLPLGLLTMMKSEKIGIVMHDSVRASVPPQTPFPSPLHHDRLGYNFTSLDAVAETEPMELHTDPAAPQAASAASHKTPAPVFTLADLPSPSKPALTDPAIPFRSQSSHRHATWARTFHSRPELYIAPQTIEEVQKAVVLARQCRRRLVVVGSGHSPSDLTCSSAWMMDLRNLNAVQQVTADEDGQGASILVQAGISLGDMNRRMAPQGYIMPNLGSIDVQSLAGAIATGTHGSSLSHGILAQSVRALRIVLADGQAVWCSFTKRPDLFRAALVSLGALGVITDIEFHMTANVNIEWTQDLESLEDTLARWNTDLWTQAQFVRCWWMPYLQRMIVWKADQTTKARRAPRTGFYGGQIGFQSYRFLLWVSNYIPRILPWIEWFIFGMQYRFSTGHVTSAVEPQADGLLMDCLFSQYVNEWALPLSKGPEAISRLSKWINGDEVNSRIPFSSRGLYVHCPIEVRVTDSSRVPANQRGYLDPTMRGEPTLYLNATLYRPYGRDPPCVKRYYEVFEWLMKDLGGRPHWAKNFCTVKKDELSTMYGEDMQSWLSVRKQVDPEGMFVGAWHRRNLIGDDEPTMWLEEKEVDRQPAKNDGGWDWVGAQAAKSLSPSTSSTPPWRDLKRIGSMAESKNSDESFDFMDASTDSGEDLRASDIFMKDDS